MARYSYNIDQCPELKIFRAKEKPRECSDVRWRIELRRRQHENEMKKLYKMSHEYVLTEEDLG